MNEHEVETIAASLHVMRPDWPAAQLRTLIRDHLLHRPVRDVLVALTWVAGDAASHSPYRVLETGPWWKAAAADRTTPARAEHHDPGRLCSVCSQPEARCRQLWATDHEYLSNEELRKEIDAQDPMVWEYRRAELREALRTWVGRP